MSFVERVNQGESLASWLNWLTEPPAVCWSVIMGDLSASCKGDTGPFQRPSERVQEAVLCTAWNLHSDLLLVSTECLKLVDTRVYTDLCHAKYISGVWWKYSVEDQLGQNCTAVSLHGVCITQALFMNLSIDNFNFAKISVKTLNHITFDQCHHRAATPAA